MNILICVRGLFGFFKLEMVSALPGVWPFLNDHQGTLL